MNKLSLRTKGLILIVLISFIPLLLAGVGNYAAVKQTVLQAEKEKISSRQSNFANHLAAWMAIRKAEVLVMSRTDVVRLGSDQERLDYFGHELVRSGFTYFEIGYIDNQGIGLRSGDKAEDRHDMSDMPFFRAATEGKVVITDPFVPELSNIPQIYIAVPVYGSGSDMIGIIYASIAFPSLLSSLNYMEESSILRLFNDEGTIIYNSDLATPFGSSITERYSGLSKAAELMITTDRGTVEANREGKRYYVFYSKVEDTPWRLAFEQSVSKLEAPLAPIFWRIVTMIILSEGLIVLFFHLYFERIVKRLERILSVTEQAADGQFQAMHLDEARRDEIGQLAHSVNGMMEHLQEMFDRLGAIINQNQLAFIVLDDQYRVSYLNKAAEEMLGYKSEELEGRATPLDYIDNDEIREEAKRLSEQLGRTVEPGIAVFKELRNDKFSYEREWTIIRKDGTRIPTLHSSNGLRDLKGRFSGVVGLVRDISESKHIEKARNRLLNIVESAKDLIASANEDGQIIYMNRAGKELLGIATADSEDFEAEVEHYMNPQMYRHLMKGAELARKYGYWEGSAQLLKLNGEPLHVSMIVVAHRDSNTGEIFFSSIARDITEQKLVQEELVRTTLEAEEANKAKSHFLALMSHEIRTPLNGIVGITQLMRKTELTAVQKDYMDKMSTSSESLLRLINDVLDFSKIEAGKIEVERLPFQPEELLQRLTNQLSIFMGGKDQFEFIIETPEHMPLMLIGDAMRLEQVLLNLCMNAIKFTSKGHVKLKLEINEQDDNQVQVTFLVSDTGIGMSREQVGKLFKPFTQADGSTTRKFGGTGLGLVISKKLVEIMGGKLEVSSEEGSGSQFYFTLPFAADTYRDHSIIPACIHSADQSVWIVEDDEQMRQHWCSIVESQGLMAVDYPSWQAASERLKRTGEGALPQLVLLDMEMPDMYGMDTWLDFRNTAGAAGVKLIVLTTSYGRDELLRLSEDQLPMAILIKPVTRMAMIRALCKTLLEERTAEHPLRSAMERAAAAIEPVRGARILLAEDNKINQLVAIEMLKECGHQVGLAENGREVLHKLAEEQWDLVLLDIHMPVMDGPEAAAIIRSLPKYDKIPIIALTANAVKKDHERYVKLGIDDVITKPVAADKLQGVISFWLNQAGRLSEALDEEKASRPGAERRKSLAARIAAGKALPPIAGMDVDSALERVGGKLPILLHMIEQFRLDYDSFMDQLHMVLKQTDTSAAIRMLHTLKGASGYLSAKELAAAVAEVEQLVKQSSADAKELQPAIVQLDTELTKLLSELKRVRTNDKNKS